MNYIDSRSMQSLSLENNVYFSAYIGQDDFPYAIVYKHGTKMYLSSALHNKQTMDIQICHYKNNIVAVFSSLNDDGDSVIKAGKLDYQGNLISSLYDISEVDAGKDQTFVSCAQVEGTDSVIILWQKEQSAGDTDIFARHINMETGALSDQKRINDSTAGKQENVILQKLKGTNSDKVIGIWQGEGMGVTAPNSGLFYYFLEPTTDIKIGVSAKIVQGTIGGSKNCINPQLQSLDNGGYLIVYEERGANEIILQTYDSDTGTPNIGCNLKVSVSAGYSPQVVLQQNNNIAYVLYKDALAAGKVRGVQVNLDSCQSDGTLGEKIVVNQQVTGQFQAQISDFSNDVATLGVTYIVELSGPSYKLYFSEYFVDQKANHACNQQNCFGCFGNYVNDCKVCKGSSYEERVTREKSVGDCSCIVGYYNDPIQLNCQKCANQCADCSGNSTNCGTCKGSNRQTAPGCGCTGNLFDDGSSADCQTCDPKCPTCQGLATNCTSCNEPTLREIPSCDCIKGHFNNATNLCESCDFNCAACQGTSNNCTECADPDWRKVSPSCICDPNGSMQDPDDATNPVCVQCNQWCLYCSGAPDQCSACTDFDSRDSSQSCICKPGYYENDKPVCATKCNQQCETCETHASNCLSCALHKIGRPVCEECEDGYYGFGVEVPCKKCPTQCKKCEQQDKCTECKTQGLLLPLCKNSMNGYFSVKNPDGTYTDAKCAPQCQQCEQAADNCQICQGLYRQNNPPECACQVGYTLKSESSADCIPCPEGCSQCESIGICLQCEQNRVLLQGKCYCKDGFILLGDQCYEECGQKEFRNENKMCQKCFYDEDDNICLSRCPSNTVQDMDSQRCEPAGVDAVKLAIIIGGIIVLLIILFLICKQIFNYVQENNEEKNMRKQHLMFQNGDNNAYDVNSDNSKNQNRQFVKQGQRENIPLGMSQGSQPDQSFVLSQSQSQINGSNIESSQQCLKQQQHFQEMDYQDLNEKIQRQNSELSSPDQRRPIGANSMVDNDYMSTNEHMYKGQGATSEFDQTNRFQNGTGQSNFQHNNNNNVSSDDNQNQTGNLSSQNNNGLRQQRRQQTVTRNRTLKLNQIGSSNDIESDSNLIIMKENNKPFQNDNGRNQNQNNNLDDDDNDDGLINIEDQEEENQQYQQSQGMVSFRDISQNNSVQQSQQQLDQSVSQNQSNTISNNSYQQQFQKQPSILQQQNESQQQSQIMQESQLKSNQNLDPLEEQNKNSVEAKEQQLQQFQIGKSGDQELQDDDLDEDCMVEDLENEESEIQQVDELVID